MFNHKIFCQNGQCSCLWKFSSMYLVNPFVPNILYIVGLVKISFLFVGGNSGPRTYELREFETIVGEPHLWGYLLKNGPFFIQALKG